MYTSCFGAFFARLYCIIIVLFTVLRDFCDLWRKKWNLFQHICMYICKFVCMYVCKNMDKKVKMYLCMVIYVYVKVELPALKKVPLKHTSKASHNKS